MILNERTEIFSKLSDLIIKYYSKSETANYNKLLNESINKATQNNPWFGFDQIRQSLLSISASINRNKIHSWLNQYPELEKKTIPKRVGIIMAGNIPLVGFMDFFYVIMSGNIALIKLSSDDNVLFPAIIEILKEINPKIDEYVEIFDNRLSGFDAIIATGSNNTSRYFEYYFGKVPNIIRKSRSSIAILRGDESFEEMLLLADDITTYYGLGCRNVSKILVPEFYDFEKLKNSISKKNNILDFHKYRNNFDYQKSVLIINRTPFIDCECVLLTQSYSLSSPISVVYYDYFYSDKDINDYIERNSDEIQCIVGNNDKFKTVSFGKPQVPELDDYADNVDVMEFLLKL